MTAPIVRDFIRKALSELKEHELREVIEALAPLIHCEVIPKRGLLPNPAQRKSL